MPKLNFALALAVGAASALAQQYTVTTIAGGAPPATPVPAVNTSIGQPRAVAADPAGNIYFASGNSVFKQSPGGTLTLIAGNSRAGYSGDGMAAVNAQLNQPSGVAIDAAGKIYISDTFNHVVRVVTPDNLINTIAGMGTPGYTGDNGPALSAQLNYPMGIAVAKNGDLYIADHDNHAVRRVTTDGNINTFAGNQVYSFGVTGDDGPANQAQLTFPTDVALDSSGNVYIADSGNYNIRQVTSDGKIHRYAGNTTNAFAGDGGDPTKASLYQPVGVAVDSSGNLYISEYGDSRIRKVTSGSGNKISTIAGNGTYGFGGDGSSATSAQLNIPRGLAVDAGGSLFVADWGNNRVRKIATGGSISTVAGNGILSYSGDGGSATNAQLNGPQSVAVDAAGNTYIADTLNNTVRQISPAGVITTFAGTGSPGFSGDGSAANKAQLNAPLAVAVDAAGNVYIADTGNLRVRVVSPNGNINTFAGNGSSGYGGDGGSATSATFYFPAALAIDKSGSVYIADFSVGVVRKVSNGTISTVAGSGATGYAGDGGPATAALINSPGAIAVDSSGNLYIAQLNDNRVRLVVPGGKITTFAGNGTLGYSGEGFPAVSSQLAAPSGLTTDSSANVYISTGNRIMKVASDGTMSTIAGNGVPGYWEGPVSSAMFNGPQGLAIDSAGNVYVADSGNNAVRRIAVAQ